VGWEPAESGLGIGFREKLKKQQLRSQHGRDPRTKLGLMNGAELGKVPAGPRGAACFLTIGHCLVTTDAGTWKELVCSPQRDSCPLEPTQQCLSKSRGTWLGELNHILTGCDPRDGKEHWGRDRKQGRSFTPTHVPQKMCSHHCKCAGGCVPMVKCMGVGIHAWG
jgi:hypothetical protein